jgi:phage repressor protein C with HTH and peptisase S24 domain
VGRHKFPLLGSAGASLHPLEPSDNPEDFVEFSDDLWEPSRRQFAVKVWGDSAEPEMRHGDYALITVDPGFRYPGFFTLIQSREQGYLVKLTKQGPQDLEFHSVNERYPPVIIEGEWEMVGIVIGWKRDKGKGRYIEAGEKEGLKPGFRD